MHWITVATALCPAFAGAYVFVGSAKSHCGYVHLYLKRQAAIRCWTQLAVKGPAVAAQVSICDHADCSRSTCTHRLKHLLVVSVHLHFGYEFANYRTRENQISQVLQDAAAGLCKLKTAVSSTVLLGDFNIRQEEESTMLKLVQGAMGKKHKAFSADYSGQSWAPMQNRFKAGGPRVPGFAFDRVFYHGDAYAASCLVEHARVHAFTSRFALSDHYAVRSVLALGLDEDKEDQPHRVGRFQGHVNMVLGKLSREEQNFLDVTEMDAKHSFHSRLAEEKHVGEQLSRKEAEQRSKDMQEQQRKRKAHWDDIFGDDLSFFSGGLAKAFSDLPQLQFDSAAFFSLCPAIASAAAMPVFSAAPRAGFCNAGNSCYVSVIAQVLLRLPAVNKFLQAHSKNCHEGSSRCVTCCLWESRGYLGQQKVPPLAEHRELVSTLR